MVEVLRLGDLPIYFPQYKENELFKNMNLPPHSPIQIIAAVARMASSFHTTADTVLFLEYAKHIPTSRPLYLLFPYL